MKRKRTPWPRWAKTTRNLLLCLLLALTVWTQLGRPLPYGLAVQRLARQNLMPEMEHHADISRGLWGDGVRFDWTADAAMASRSVSPGARLTYFYDPYVTFYSLTDGPNLLCSPWTTALLPGEGGFSFMEHYAFYVAVFPPEEGASAALTLHNNSGTFTVPGQREDEVFIFYARPEPEEDGSRQMDNSWFDLDEFTYELTFYDETGKIVNQTQNHG